MSAIITCSQSRAGDGSQHDKVRERKGKEKQNCHYLRCDPLNRKLKIIYILLEIWRAFSKVAKISICENQFHFYKPANNSKT